MNANSRATVAIAMLAAVVTGPARAQSNKGEELFQSGRAALNEGKYELARTYFEQSYEADPALGTLLNLAVCEEKVGRLAAARSHLETALKAASTADKRRPLIADRLTDLDHRTPRLTIRTHPAIEKGTVVLLDSRPLDRTDLETTIRIDPGRHEIACAGSSDQHCSLSFTVVEHEDSVQNVAITISVRVSPPPVPPLAGTPAPREPHRPLFAYGLGAVGVASIAAGLATGAVVIQKKHIVDQHCQAAGCDPTGLAAAESGKTFSLVSTALTGLGVIAVGSSAYLLLTVPISASPTTAVTVVGEF